MKAELGALFPVCAIKDSKLFCVTDMEHIFEKIDIHSGEVEYIDDPQGYNPKDWSGTGTILTDTDVIYLVEQNGKRIMKYFLSDHTCQYILLSCHDYICSNFAGVTIYKGQMYLFPRYRDSVLKVDLGAGRVEAKGSLCPDVQYQFDTEDIPCALFSCSCQVENHMWIFTEKERVVIDYDITLERFERYLLPESIKTCVWAEYKDNLFYILTKEGKLYKWLKNEEMGEEIYDFGLEKKYPYFNLFVIAGGSLWLLPGTGGEISVIDLENRTEKIYDNYPNGFKYFAPETWSKYFTKYEDEKYYYFSMHSGNYILSIDKTDGQEKWIQPQKIEQEKRADFYLRNKRGRLIIESACYDMADLIMLLQGTPKAERPDADNGNGNLIWLLTGRKVI